MGARRAVNPVTRRLFAAVRWAKPTSWPPRGPHPCPGLAVPRSS